MKRGFTLVELLLVVTIIGILATLIMANLSSARARARDAQRKNDIRQVQNALAMRYLDVAHYPIYTSGVRLSVLDEAGVFTQTNGTRYLKKVPQDPRFKNSTKDYCYRSDQEGRRYVIWAQLENRTDNERYNPATGRVPIAELNSACGDIADPKFFVQSE